MRALPLTLENGDGISEIEMGDVLSIPELRPQLSSGVVRIEDLTRKRSLEPRHDLSLRQLEVLLAGGLINWVMTRKNGR